MKILRIHALSVLALCLVALLMGCDEDSSGADSPDRIVASTGQMIDVDSTNDFSSLIVKYKIGKTVAKETMAKRFARFGSVKFKKFSNLNEFAVVTFDRDKFSFKGIRAQIAADANIEYVEPNYIMRAFAAPNDPYYRYQWNLKQLNMAQAWDITMGNPEVKVAVIDSGVAYDLDDFAATRFDLQNDRDFVDNDDDAYDQNSHGSHCAGTIAQSTNNRLGTAGMAPGVTILPLRVLDKTGVGELSDICDAIVWAADHGAQIISLSLGGGGYSNTLKSAVRYAYEKGVAVFAATGNNGSGTVSYPAAFDDYVIAVGAVRYDKQRAGYSQYGESLDIMAPGGDLSVDQDRDGYVDGILQETIVGYNWRGIDYTPVYSFFDGTSMACPHAAALGALLKSHNFNATPDHIRAAIQNTAEDLGSPGWEADSGYGLIDPVAALNYIGGQTVTDPAGPVCHEWSATINQHVTAGRAYARTTGGCDPTTVYYLVGSNERLGASGNDVQTLHTTDEGQTYIMGNCPF